MPKKNEPRTALGRDIRAVRERLRYSQDDFGALLAVSATIISRWETGQHKPPVESLAHLAEIAADTERDKMALFNRWVHMAGFGKAPPETEDGHGVTITVERGGATVEGIMARAAIDQVRNSAKRLQLLLYLREKAQQLQGDDEDSLPILDQPQTPLALPAPPDDPASKDTQP